MTSTDMHDAARRHRALRRSSAQQREELLSAQHVARETERLRLLEADAAKTARLRALRLAKEAAEAEPAAPQLKGVSVLP